MNFVLREVAGYWVSVLLNYSSQPRTAIVHKRLREYPVHEEPSTSRVSIEHPEPAEIGIELLKHLGWQGAAMVEFKMDEENGDIMLIEVNGRFWGSLPLAIKAGVDFPYLLYKLKLGENVVPCYSYGVGVMHRWLMPGDLLWLFASLQKSQKGKLRNLMTFFNSFQIPNDIISLSDLSPTFGVMLDTARSFFDVICGKQTIYGENTLRNA